MNDQELVKKLQDAQLDLLKELDRVCGILNIQYSVTYGTAIGALRHKGFIPWDDDVDVHMLAEDLETLKQHKDLFREKYFLQDSDSDPEYGLMITRLRNSETTLVEDTETDRDMNHGVFMDIYPMFNSPQGGFRFKRMLIASRIYRLLLYARVPKNHSAVVRAGSMFLLKVIPKGIRKSIRKRCWKTVSSCPHTGYRACFYSYGSAEWGVIPEKWLFPAVRTPFEDFETLIGPDMDAYLRFLSMFYGDYMQLPPEEKRVFHHNYACVDTEKSYREYKGIAYCREKAE